MRSSSLGFAAALAGTVAAANQPAWADVYVVPQAKGPAAHANTEPITQDRGDVRMALLQRLAPETSGPWAAYDPTMTEEALQVVNAYGRAPQPLFGDADASSSTTSRPSQLLIILEGATQDNAEAIAKGFDVDATDVFHIQNPPSAEANRRLAQEDLRPAGVVQTDCELERAMNPLDESCWKGKSSVAIYDVKKDPSVATVLADNIARLTKLAHAGEMETTVIVVPESARSSSVKYWSAPANHHRRQIAEEVMSEVDEPVIAAASPAPAPISADDADDKHAVFTISAKKAAAIPSCFSSEDSCLNATGSCSGHGKCLNRYARNDGAPACFACSCAKETSKKSGPTQWAGPTCSKVDVSVPFWLFFGLTLTMLGVVWFAISLLFSVGEEKLPGVIGAGVSKTK